MAERKLHPEHCNTSLLSADVMLNKIANIM